jgi:hypothetical protein
LITWLKFTLYGRVELLYVNVKMIPVEITPGMEGGE